MKSEVKLENLLPASFYAHDTREVARKILGKILAVAHSTAHGQTILAGRIVEVEAYRTGDPAAHSARGITKRSKVLFEEPGNAYVYTMHRQRLLNFVTEPNGHPGGVLIRGLEPLIGLDTMMLMRPDQPLHNLTNGPGKLSQALGIQMSDNRASLQGPRLFVFEDDYRSDYIKTSSRIGISKGQDLEWRFYLSASPFVSKFKESVK
jgi:DNA-3-methyladenine glycosylase